MTRKLRNFTRAVDQAIAEENRRFLADPDAIREAEEDGDRYRLDLEAQGILPLLFDPVCLCGERKSAHNAIGKWIVCPNELTEWQVAR